jgi:hypothetical protein
VAATAAGSILQTSPATRTTARTQVEFDEATLKGYPHFSWFPPEWPAPTDPEPVLEDTVTDAPTYQLDKHPLNCVTKLTDRVEELKEKHADQLKHVKSDRGFELLANTDPTDPLIDVPHPESDVSHVDPVVPGDDKKRICTAIERLEELKGTASRDGELADAFNQALLPLRKAKELCFEDPNNPKKEPKGMRRLRLVFEFMLCHTTTLFGEMNDALEAVDWARYNQARDRYLALLKDWDDHEPQAVTAGEFGYGRAIKWNYIHPLIHEGKIKGAMVIAKWNPHLSSSGIPIPHS